MIGILDGNLGSRPCIATGDCWDCQNAIPTIWLGMLKTDNLQDPPSRVAGLYRFRRGVLDPSLVPGKETHNKTGAAAAKNSGTTIPRVGIARGIRSSLGICEIAGFWLPSG
jgi:hypothetical protein